MFKAGKKETLVIISLEENCKYRQILGIKATYLSEFLRLLRTSYILLQPTAAYASPVHVCVCARAHTHTHTHTHTHSLSLSLSLLSLVCMLLRLLSPSKKLVM
jgi:hypothetical protein